MAFLARSTTAFKHLAGSSLRSGHAAALSQQTRTFKVAVVGAAGGIGQPLGLLLKTSPLVTHLSLYDLAPVTPGVAADLSHMDTTAKVTGHTGPDELGAALKDCDVVVVPAGVPRKPGMTRDDLFNINASIVAGIGRAAAENCPNAALCIISNPVNSTVPIMAEVLKKHGCYNPNKLFGVTTLDVSRANTFIAENQGQNVDDVSVSVIGGHAGITIIPLLSQVPGASFQQEDVEALTKRIMFGGDEVVEAKAGGGSATLSMAYAGFQFAHRVLQALDGEEGVVENTYVEDPNRTYGPKFFSTPVEIGREGIVKIHTAGDLNNYEQGLLAAAVPELEASIAKGEAYVAENYEA